MSAPERDGPRTSLPEARGRATQEAGPLSAAASNDASRDGDRHDRPEGFRRVSALLSARGHAHAPRFLEIAARTAQEAADVLGVGVGQIAKSVVFRRLGDDAAVLVVTSGDRRVDEHKVSALIGALGRADAAFVKARTGFTIGGVAPLGHATRPVALIDRELFRFDEIWAAAGHPRGVFQLTPQQLVELTGAPVRDVTQA
ncbi:MAG: YbaK/EbsC family protein [Burkholderiaceae bacterium]